jgi:acid phosphatase family membrane protein YuiD
MRWSVAPWLFVVLSAIACQLVKFCLYSVANRRLDARALVTTNGLPSVYAVTFGCLSTIVLSEYGLRSPTYVLCFIFGGMVLHDSIRLRGSVDRSSEASFLLAQRFSADRHDGWLDQFRPLLVDRRHRPMHVAVGLTLGSLCGLLWQAPTR